MSTLPPLTGHDEARASLARAVLDGALPGSLLVHGPAGVGKQRLGLWLAQRIVCAETGQAEPCGRCHPCRLVLRLEHPDVHWFFPLPRPRSSGGLEKLIDAVEEARAEELAARRADPYRPPPLSGEPVGIYLAQVHAIRRLATSRPVMGDRQVFLVGNAEYLVPQESSPEAANAFLKLLEEPPENTTFILTASDPDVLLPTLRSRMHPVRLRPLPEPEVAAFLREARGVDEGQARSAARLAQGSIGRALAFLPSNGEPGPLEELRQQARALLKAAAASAPLSRMAAAHGVGPTGARGSFQDVLDFLGLWLRDLAAVASGADDAVINTDATAFLGDLARRLPAADAGTPDALRLVDEARALAHGNVNPQLILAWLLRSLHGVLSGRETIHSTTRPWA